MDEKHWCGLIGLPAQRPDLNLTARRCDLTNVFLEELSKTPPYALNEANAAGSLSRYACKCHHPLNVLSNH